MTFTLTVPGTDRTLTESNGQLIADDVVFCSAGEGIWDLIRPDRRQTLDRFAADYAAVRAVEHREMTPGEVQTLPIVRPDHPLADMWQQRAASHARFKHSLEPTAPGHMIDIGAGSGWLAADMARDDWTVAAIDVTVDGGDGLSSARYHGAEILLARAEMEALPFASGSVDLAVFNASLHYAGRVVDALAEAARVVRPGGYVVVLDSPVFENASAGEQMVHEFAAQMKRAHGLSTAAHEGPGFVTETDLAALDFDRTDAVTGIRKRLHQWRGARRAGRETASRPLLIARIGDHP